MVEWVIVVGFIIVIAAWTVLIDKIIKKEIKAIGKQEPPNVIVDMQQVHRALDALPNKVLQSIVSKNNNLKGEVGELIGFMQLQAAYDRVIPLGNIVDFIGIKLPREGQDGTIDFIDIKTGKAKLSKDQVQMRKLVEEKKIRFIKMKVETNAEAGHDGADPS